MNEHPRRIQKPMDAEALVQSEAIYLSIWNMDCPDCATWLHNGLTQPTSVLKVDIFYQQDVGVIIYIPAKTTPSELLKMVQKIGWETCRYCGAEIIGQCTAKQALRLA